IVLAEAMAAGVPVVCSNLPGYAEAAGGAASVFPAGDAAAAGASILRVLREPGLRKALIDKGNARAAELDWDVLSEKVLATYRRAVS
ncbi:MAG: glycosyltransferase, partial [Actinomycetota bacterium]